MQEGDGGIRFAILVAEMGARMCYPGIVRVLSDGSVDLRARRTLLAGFDERHAMVGVEPPIVAIVGGETVQQVYEFALPPGSAGEAD